MPVRRVWLHRDDVVLVDKPAVGGPPMAGGAQPPAVGGGLLAIVDADPPAVGDPPMAEGEGDEQVPPHEFEPLPLSRFKNLKGQREVRLAVHGGAVKSTRGGLERTDLMFKPGTTKVISIKKSTQTKQVYHDGGGSPLKRWNAAVSQARRELGFDVERRFVPVGGETISGQLLKMTAREIYDGRGRR